METFLTIRKAIKDFFDKYELYLMPCLKFLLAFFSFVMINRTLSYFDALNNGFILVILSLLCAILPVTSIAIIGIILIILQCFAAHLIIGVAALCFFILLIILLLRFVPSDMLWVILTPFGFMLNIPAVIPVSLGILRNRSSIAAGIGGIAVYCFLSDLPRIASQASLGRIEKIEIVQELIKSFIGHEELILSSIVFTAVILIVNLIRRMLTKYTYLVAVLAGCVFYLILRALGRVYLEVSGDVKKDLIGTFFSAVICLIIAFFIHCADYKRTQVLQFEDDEYYYYVKAVPKRTPDTPDEYDDDLDPALFGGDEPEEENEPEESDEKYPYEDEKTDPVYMEDDNKTFAPGNEAFVSDRNSFAPDPEPFVSEEEAFDVDENAFDPDISDFDEDPDAGFGRYN